MSNEQAQRIRWDEQFKAYRFEDAQGNVVLNFASPQAGAEHHYAMWCKVERLRETLLLILPLAKGYAQAHPVGSNQKYVEEAEALAVKEASDKPKGNLGLSKEAVEGFGRIIKGLAAAGIGPTEEAPDE